MQGRQSIAENSRGGERVRLYEVAKEVGLPNKELVAKVRAMGIDVKNHMSSMNVEEVRRVKRELEKERIESREVKRISATVIRRRSKGRKKADAAEAPATQASEVRVDPPKTAPKMEGEPTPIVSAPKISQEQIRAEASKFESMLEQSDQEKVKPLAPQASASLRDKRSDEQASKQDAGQVTQSVASQDINKEEQKSVVVDAKSSVHTTGQIANDASTSNDDVKAATADRGQVAGLASKQDGLSSSSDADKPSIENDSARQDAQRDDAIDSAKSDAQKEEKKEEKIDFDDLPINSPLRRKAELQKREIRFAPGFKPQQQRKPAAPKPTQASEAQPLSAADALKMLTPTAPRRNRPQVVITDLDKKNMESTLDRRFKSNRRKKKQAAGRKGKKTEITTPAEHKRVIRVEDTISVGDIARQMGAKSTQVLRKLWAMGLTNIMITHSIDADTASLLASEFGYEVEDVTFKEADVLLDIKDAPENLESRAPVVTVMGHVDHGKTSLLDAIRGSHVVKGEAGGITQHIGAYRVNTEKGEIVFLDTPGHAAFTAMRARGAQCTDIVILVVAADDGVMPQTVEAIEHAQDAGVPIVVALNKIDRPDSNPDRILSELSERGLVAESWGGETMVIPTSAIKNEGISEILDSILLQSEMLELLANPNKMARGSVVEAKMDRARGAMCTVLVQDGTLNVGDTVVVGEHMGKVRAMLDDYGNSIEKAGPSTPVELLGLSGVPGAGDTLNAVADDKDARTLAEHRRNQARKRELGSASAKATYEDILTGLQSGELKELKLLVKSDVQGSSEAIKESLRKLSTEKVEVNVISAGVGGIHETDVNLAKAAGAVIVGFNVRTAGKASVLAEREGVEIRTYDVIYELLDEMKTLMRGLLPKLRSERMTGRAEVRQTFSIPKIGMIGGCGVIEGKISRNAHLRLIRDSVKIYDGKVSSLKRFKDDVREVVQGYECGIGIEGYNQLKEGDIIEAYEIDEITPDL